MKRTPTQLAFIRGYMLVANTIGGVQLTEDDPSWDDVLEEHRALWDISAEDKPHD